MLSRFGGGGGDSAATVGPPCEDERLVQACVRTAQAQGITDPFVLAREARGWNREQWDTAYLIYRTNQSKRWHQQATGTTEEGIGLG